MMRTLKLKRPLVVFDLETTGPNPHQDRVVEIAMVTMHPDGSREKWSSLINPGRSIPQSAIDVHGITNEAVKDAPSFTDIAPKVVETLRDRDVGGFNAGRFDMPLLVRELEAANIALPDGIRHMVDAQVIFHRMEPRDLSAAVRYFCDREHAGAHGALADAEATLDVILAQVDRYQEPGRTIPDTVEALDELCSRRDESFIDPEGKIQWDGDEAVIGFGKHRGVSLREIARRAPDYLDWILRKDFSAEVKQIIRDVKHGDFPSKN